MPRFYTSDLFKADDRWEDFRADFIEYKTNGIIPDIFGRDETLTIKPLSHIHLASDEATEKKWRKIPIGRQHLRTIIVGSPDYWLIYAYDDCEDGYLLLAIMGPEAHNGPKWNGFMTSLKTQIVEPWIQGRVTYYD
jgi:mRNA interferase YafO